MKILALEIELPGAEEAAFRAQAKEEAARAWELYQEGIIRELYYRQDRPEAVLMLECAGVEEAARILATLAICACPSSESVADALCRRHAPGPHRVYAQWMIREAFAQLEHGFDLEIRLQHAAFQLQ